MNPVDNWITLETRRQFFGRSAKGIGAAALASLVQRGKAAEGGALGGVHFPARAKRVIWLFMAGAPSQLDLFDHKPGMNDWFDKDLPESVRGGQRLTTMTASQSRFPIAPSMFKFGEHGECRKAVSELLPKTAQMVDLMKRADARLVSNDIVFIRYHGMEATADTPFDLGASPLDPASF